MFEIDLKFMDQEKMLVLGFGNEVLTDDGVGVKVVTHFKELNENPQIVYETSWLGGLDILDHFIEDYQTAVFIDASKTGNVEPGTIEQYDLDNFKETLHLSNFHDANFINTIKLGSKLGYRIPGSIIIISIEIVEDELFGNNFSKEIEGKYKEILKTINAIVQSFSKKPD